MNKLFKKKVWRLPIALLAVIAMLAIGGGAVLASGFTLNEEIPATVTVEFPAEEATLYTDLECTMVWSGTMDFDTLTAVGQTATQLLYFKANKSTSVPGGYGFGEIDPASISVTTDVDSGVATFMYVVGEPFGAVINGNHPCMITFSVTAVGEGTTDFIVTVTGNS